MSFKPFPVQTFYQRTQLSFCTTMAELIYDIENTYAHTQTTGIHIKAGGVSTIFPGENHINGEFLVFERATDMLLIKNSRKYGMWARKLSFLTHS